MQSVQIQASEKVKVLGYNCVINDVFYASEIEQVSICACDCLICYVQFSVVFRKVQS